MKTITSVGLSLVFVLFAFAGFAQIDKNTKTNTKLNQHLNNTMLNNTVVDANLDLKLKQVPEFSNIQPTSNTTAIKPMVKVENLQKANMLNNPTMTVRTSSINGKMTPRNPYHSSLAYLEFLTGDVNPSTNEVFCRCGSGGLTYVKLNLSATAGKRYLVTIEHSPVSNSHGLSLFTNSFVHQASAAHNNTKTDIVLSASRTGLITLWAQCSDPNGSKRAWKFHSAEVKELE